MKIELDLTGTEWMDSANCLSVDPNLMQPETATPEDVERAKGVCTTCPVFLQCRQAARDQLPAYGVWAGEWHGPPPRLAMTCEWCGTKRLAERSGGRFCGDPCRKAAHKAKRSAQAMSA